MFSLNNSTIIVPQKLQVKRSEWFIAAHIVPNDFREKKTNNLKRDEVPLICLFVFVCVFFFSLDSRTISMRGDTFSYSPASSFRRRSHADDMNNNCVTAHYGSLPRWNCLLVRYDANKLKQAHTPEGCGFRPKGKRTTLCYGIRFERKIALNSKNPFLPGY